MLQIASYYYYYNQIQLYHTQYKSLILLAILWGMPLLIVLWFHSQIHNRYSQQSRYMCGLVVMHCCDDNCCIGLSNSAVSGITFAVSVPITAVVTAIISCLITYYCCVKSKEGYLPSPTDPPALYKTPVSTSGVSSLEMKDNMAYGHVTIGTSGNIHSTSTVYETVQIT